MKGNTFEPSAVSAFCFDLIVQATIVVATDYARISFPTYCQQLPKLFMVSAAVLFYPSTFFVFCFWVLLRTLNALIRPKYIPLHFIFRFH